MRHAIYRLTAPILDRIPDISHRPKRWQISLGVVASIVVHLLLLLFAGVVGLILPEHSLIKFIQTKPQLQEIEITVLPPEPTLLEEVRVVPLEEAKPFLDSTGLAPAEKPPEKTVFESGADMRAASQLPARGDVPLPSQDGRRPSDSPQFLNQQASLDPAKPTPPPPEAAMPENAPAPSLTEDLKPVENPTENEIAMLAKNDASPSKEPPADRALLKKLLRANIQMPAKEPTPSEPAPVEESVRPPALHQEQTPIDGDITNRGANAVDAAATPLGRYKEGVGRAVGSRWTRYTKDNGDRYQFGSALVRFTIDRRGKVRNFRLENNTSNPAFASMCEQAVRDSKFPLPSGDVIDVVRDGEIEVSFRFTLY